MADYRAFCADVRAYMQLTGEPLRHVASVKMYKDAMGSPGPCVMQ